jgi:2-iminobutanoate/2-iminopropanoate deaminase
MSEGCQKKIISTEKAPKAIGPYSAGVKVSHFVYTAGQLGLDPTTGNLVTGGVEAETRQALQNLKAILEAADAKLEDVVKTTVFLKDMNDFQKMNGIYAEFFTSDAPARSAVQVVALPKGGAVEIEAVAFISSETCDCC